MEPTREPMSRVRRGMWLTGRTMKVVDEPKEWDESLACRKR
jgi:hypothetical protein